VVSLLFPLGSLFFGFVQQRRAAVTQTDLEEDALEMERKIRLAELQARLEEANAKKHAAKARGAVGVLKAGVRAMGEPDSMPPATEATQGDANVGADELNAFEGSGVSGVGVANGGRRTPEQADVLRAAMLTQGYPLGELSEKENERVFASLVERRRQPQVLTLLHWTPEQYDAAVKQVRRQRQATGKQ
jgi:hypothetical protein